MTLKSIYKFTKDFYKDFIHMHLILLYKTYNNLNCKVDGNLFCLMFNIKSILIRKDIRFEKDNHNKLYIAKSRKYKRYFLSKEQNVNYLSKGFTWRYENLAREYMLNKIEFISSDVIIDCGANIGDFEIFFKEKNLDVDYLAFEPSPNEFKCLKRNLLLPNSKCFNYALFNEEKTFNFYISSENADSSLFKPKSYSAVKKVKAKRLDIIFKELELRKIKLLKLEAEGAEPEIILGCIDILPNIEYITADLGFERGINEDSTLPKVSNILLNNDFEMVDINGPRLTCLFKNNNFKA